MLFALRQPATLLGLVLGFAVGCLLRATLQQAVIGGLRSVRRANRLADLIYIQRDAGREWIAEISEDELNRGPRMTQRFKLVRMN